MTVEERLQEKGYALPQAQPPQAMYIPAVKTDKLVYTAGQGPLINGQIAYSGNVSEERMEWGKEAARVVGLNLLAALRSVTELENVKRVVKLNVFVSSAPGFTNQHLVANGVSEIMHVAFGDDGKHARTAVAVPALPTDIPVEAEAVFELY